MPRLHLGEVLIASREGWEMTSEPVRPKLDLVMPVHNEGGAIERTLRERYAELSPAVDLRFIIAEDGSRDNTLPGAARLTLSSGTIPADLASSRHSMACARLYAWVHFQVSHRTSKAVSPLPASALAVE